MYFLFTDIGVINANCTDYDTKLVDGLSFNEGRVLICINGLWGNHCSKHINSNDAKVICQTLGFKQGLNLSNRHSNNHFIGGTTYIGHFPNGANNPMLFTDIGCANSAASLIDCTKYHFTKTSTCDTRSITAVRCQCI